MPACVRRAERVLFFGGSFDPPHAAHAELPFAAAERWWPEGPRPWVVFVPAARSPHKAHAPAPDRHRAEMLRIALRDRRRWWIWEDELARAEAGEPSFWADTWRRARAAFGASEAVFLIGADQALAMHRWSRYREIWRDAVVLARPGTDAAALCEGLERAGVWTPAEIDRWAARTVPLPMLDASSTAVRAALADPDRRNGPIPGLDEGVRRYAVERGLYAPA